jgi:hypothetical protein
MRPDLRRRRRRGRNHTLSPATEASKIGGLNIES